MDSVICGFSYSWCFSCRESPGSCFYSFGQIFFSSPGDRVFWGPAPQFFTFCPKERSGVLIAAALVLVTSELIPPCLTHPSLLDWGCVIFIFFTFPDKKTILFLRVNTYTKEDSSPMVSSSNFVSLILHFKELSLLYFSVRLWIGIIF